MKLIKYFPAFIFAGVMLTGAAQIQKNHDHSARSSMKKSDMPGTYSELPGEHVLGSRIAPLTLIAYASVTCPHCAQWFTRDWPNLKVNYVNTGKLRIVFREFPTSPQKIAVAGFQLANCAPQENYFDVIEHLMREQHNTFAAVKQGKGIEVFLAHAKVAGIEDETVMNTCFNSQEGYEKIMQSVDLASAADITGVPFFILGGNPYKGATEYTAMKAEIDRQLISTPKP